MENIITVKCKHCHKSTSFNLYDEQTMKLTKTFSLSNVEHIRALQQFYNVHDENLVITKNKNIFHAACLVQKSQKKMAMYPLVIFLQLYYLSLSKIPRQALLAFVQSKDCLHGISQRSGLLKFSQTFQLMHTQLALFFQFDAATLQRFQICEDDALAGVDVSDADEPQDEPHDLSIEVGRNAAVASDEHALDLSNSLREFYDSEVVVSPAFAGATMSTSILEKTLSQFSGDKTNSFLAEETDENISVLSDILFEGAVSSQSFSPVSSPVSVVTSTPRSELKAPSIKSSPRLRAIRANFLQQTLSPSSPSKVHSVRGTLKTVVSQLANCGVDSSITIRVIQDLFEAIIHDQDIDTFIERRIMPVVQVQKSLAVRDVAVNTTETVVARVDQAIAAKAESVDERVAINKLQSVNQQLQEKIDDLTRENSELQDRVGRARRQITHVFSGDSAVFIGSIQDSAVGFNESSHLLSTPQRRKPHYLSRRRLFQLIALLIILIAMLIMVLINCKIKKPFWSWPCHA